MIKYLALLRYNRNLRILTSIQMICYFGMWFSHTGIFTLLIDLKAPVWALTLAAAMAFIPNVFLAPINGIIIDKFNPKPMMIFLMFIETLSVLMLVFIDDLSLLWLLFVLIFVRMGVGVTYFQTEMSLLPNLLSKKNLKLANEIHSIIWAASYTAGMGIAGVFIHCFGVKEAFLFDFALYIFGMFLLTKLNIPNIVKTKTQKAFLMMKEGLKYIKNNPLIVHLILLHSFVGITAYDNLIALMASYQYKEILSASLIIGFMNMTRALSLVVGPIMLSKFINTKTLFWLFIGEFLGIGLWAILQFNYYLGLIGLIAAGFCTSSLWSFTFTMLQNSCDKKFYGRVIAYKDMVYFIISAFVSLAIGAAYELGISLMAITFSMGSAFLIGAFYYKFVYEKYKL
ncbi:putative integral membrane protein [Campylobacter hyointestinalis subsp. hyointestinalis]|uniref:Integral membrane protein n=1 Tax=Campylobacter hyointestinalis subsp. hyointestinalis TaxID=91352 RepID=A0A9W5ANE2_CAMHY|nr:H+ antiporter protein, major facilitator superfamily [Campylobacter hyointestinalis subsp. hyointestinalis LMG 9260]PPB52632.1 MFS transporter [Campylobacter hyointestinalis subsp. hyointestinalis]PPB67529.1 MFS transporter [Campylobacter hyointestinalis subsp. hyointestinalis]CUU70239.1 putative integral membrane protein [Campylobacter hyointestinalis subsp. hyointestinalis]CUU76641.1 putative integral membrane protein [Campylobacter hyointestinalis subsp. hyointestinalis]